MLVSQDQNTALLGTFKALNQVNRSHQRLQLKGLAADKVYRLEGRAYTGAELMRVGLVTTDASSGQLLEDSEQKPSYDFDSKLWLFEAEDE